MQSLALKAAIFNSFAHQDKYALIGLNKDFKFYYKNRTFWDITNHEPIEDFLFSVENKDKHKAETALNFCLQYPLEPAAIQMELNIAETSDWNFWEFIALPDPKYGFLIFGVGKQSRMHAPYNLKGLLFTPEKLIKKARGYSA